MTKEILRTLIAIGVLAVAIAGYSFLGGAQSPATQTTPVTENLAPLDDYVRVVESDARSATFVFSVPVRAEDVIGEHMEHCVVGVSVGSAGNPPDCTPMTMAQGYWITYDEPTNSFTTRNDVIEWGEGFGPFRIGCAACESAVRFSNIHTKDGTLLPEKLVSVY